MTKADKIVGGLCAVWVVAVGLVAMQAYGGPPALFRSATAAAWAQAMGGLFAIVAALLVGQSQIAAQTRLHDRRVMAFESAARELLSQMAGNLMAIDDAFEAIKDPVDLVTTCDVMGRQLRASAEAGKAFPYYEIEDLQILQALRLTTAQLMSAAGLIDRTRAAIQQNGGLPLAIKHMWTEAKDEASDRVDALSKS